MTQENNFVNRAWLAIYMHWFKYQDTNDYNGQEKLQRQVKMSKKKRILCLLDKCGREKYLDTKKS